MVCFYEKVWKNFGFIGSFLYLLIQVCFLILFADEVADELVSRMEDSDSRGPLCLLVTISLANYILSAIGIILFYVYYGGSGCSLHKFLISINMIMIVSLSLVSILPSVQECEYFNMKIFSFLINYYNINHFNR